MALNLLETDDVLYLLTLLPHLPSAVMTDMHGISRLVLEGLMHAEQAPCQLTYTAKPCRMFSELVLVTKVSISFFIGDVSLPRERSNLLGNEYSGCF